MAGTGTRSDLSGILNFCVATAELAWHRLVVSGSIGRRGEPITSRRCRFNHTEQFRLPHQENKTCGWSQSAIPRSRHDPCPPEAPVCVMRCMKPSIPQILLILLTLSAALPSSAGNDLLIADAKIYDQSGRYQGRTDSNGRRYDSMGRYEGRIEDSGRIYDEKGRYQGRIEERSGDQRHYDAMGRYIGRQDDDGRRYDAQGRYQGRIDSNGREYDAQGRYTGRIHK